MIEKHLERGESIVLDRIYRFEGGPIDLFTIEKNGKRHFLVQITKGLLFPLKNPEGYELIVLCTNKTAFFEAPSDPLALNVWIETLSAVLARPVSEGKQKYLHANSTFESEEKTILLSRKGTIWIEFVEGKGSLFGEFPITSKTFPLPPYFWIEMEGSAKIRAQETGQDGTLFAAYFSQLLPPYLKSREANEKALLEIRSSQEQEDFTHSLKEIEEVLSPPLNPGVRQFQDPLCQACEIVADAADIHLIFPKEQSASLSLEKSVRLICDASQIRYRKVKLRNLWWKTDHGPLLAFEGEEKKPVALFYEGSYVKVLYNQKERIEKKEAETFSPFAYTFYPSLLTKATTGKSILSFLLKNNCKTLLLIALFSALSALVAFFPPIATKLLFNYAIPETDRHLVFYLSVGLLASTVTLSYFSFIATYLSLRLNTIVTSILQTSIWDRILKLSPSFFRKLTVGDLLWRIQAVQEICTTISGNNGTIILTGLFSFLYVFIMAAYSPLLTLIVMGCALIGFLSSLVASYLKIQILDDLYEWKGNLRGIVVQMINGIAKLRTAGAEKSAFAYWGFRFAELKALEMKSILIQNAATTVNLVMPMLASSLIYVAILSSPFDSLISISNFLAFIIATSGFSAAIYPLNFLLTDLAEVVPLWRRTRPILQEPLEESLEKIAPLRCTGLIDFTGISFSYELDGPPTLSDITLQIKPQEFVAIVGPSGSGKSTLIRLLLGFEKPQTGAIYFDDKDLSTLDLRSIRKQIGSVFQNEGILAGSLYDNLTCGGIYTKEQIERALDLSGFSRDLDSFPMGLHTYMQARGVTMSGGQKQRLLLARAIISNPRILILDEATSALDNINQESVTENIEALHVTRIVIAQRLSTIRKADRIYVLEKGKIVQTGSYEELTRTPGLFASMVERQSL